MSDKLLHILTEYPFCGLKLQVETFGHSFKWTNLIMIQSPKVIEPTNKKTKTKKVPQKISMLRHKNEGLSIYFLEVFFPTPPVHRTTSLIFMTSLSDFLRLLFRQHFNIIYLSYSLEYDNEAYKGKLFIKLIKNDVIQNKKPLIGQYTC